MKAIVAACFLSVVAAESCNIPCNSFQNAFECAGAALTTCALCNWDHKRTPRSERCYNDPNLCSDCSCRSNAEFTCPLIKTKDRCERFNKGDCVVCGWSNGKCAKTSCSAPCSHFKSKTACEDAMSGVCPYDCKWDASEDQCEGSLERAVEGGLTTFVIIIIVVAVLVVLIIVACLVVGCCCCTGAAAASAMNKKSNTVMLQEQQTGYTQHQ
eukprot:TRINITY_DN3732_c0_g1_i1.p2 TRINITY_DN3732_c0_g1~~TRINITY_DN3732_c0_g1_i1.p2  ORF type:complete len:212 (+),score=62.49 TRINITY_DN3732_c0_g1_i1:63-698(+)